MRRRISPILLALVLSASLVPSALAASGSWTVSASADLVSAHVISSSADGAQLSLENHVSLEPFDLPAAGAVLDALGFGGGYSQEVSWSNAGTGPIVSCPNMLVDLLSFCHADSSGGWALIPEGIPTTLELSGPAGIANVLVKPTAHSVEYDTALAAIAVALSVISSNPKGVIIENLHLVASLAAKIAPEAFGYAAAAARKDYAAAGFELLSLSKRAAATIADSVTQWSIGALADLSPFALELKLGLAIGQIDTTMVNLAARLLIGDASSVITVTHGGGQGALQSPTATPTATPTSTPETVAPSAPTNAVVKRGSPTTCPADLSSSDSYSDVATCVTWQFTWTSADSMASFRLYAGIFCETIGGGDETGAPMPTPTPDHAYACERTAVVAPQGARQATWVGPDDPNFLFRIRAENSAGASTVVLLEGSPGVPSEPPKTPTPTEQTAPVTLRYVSQAGSQGSGPDQFYDPSGIATDGKYIYVADAGNHRIVKRLASDLSYVAEIDGQGYGPFAGGIASAPFDIATDGKYLYVADTGWNRIEKLTVDLVPVMRTGSQGSGAGQFDAPYGVATDGTYVYVTDSGNGRIVKLRASDLGFVASMPLPPDGNQMLWPNGIATNGQFLFVADNGAANDRVLKLSASDLSVVAQAHDGQNNGGLWGIATSGTSVYISDGFWGPIAELRSDDLSLAGLSDQPTGKQFLAIYGLATDGTYVYVADDGNNRIVKLQVSR